jgi:paraquat-inducible protein B
MGKKVSPTLIGAFVVGAIGLVVVCLVFFSSFRLFSGAHRFILFFDGSVDGLGVGAPVKFKGVEIGSVDQIQLQFDSLASGESPPIPVVIEVDENKLSGRLGRPVNLTPERMKEVIDSGLRAKLATQSLVTGLLFISLDLYPDTPARLVGSNLYQEIPTVPSTSEEVIRTLTEVVDRIRALPLEHLVQSMTETVDGLNRIVNAPEAQRVAASLDDTLTSVRKLSDRLNEKVVPVADDLRAGVHDARESIRDIAQGATASLKELDTTLAAIRDTLQPDSALGHDIASAVAEVVDAARSVRTLADSLDREPSSVVFGRQPIKGDK